MRSSERCPSSRHALRRKRTTISKRLPSCNPRSAKLSSWTPTTTQQRISRRSSEAKRTSDWEPRSGLISGKSHRSIRSGSSLACNVGMNTPKKPVRPILTRQRNKGAHPSIDHAGIMLIDKSRHLDVLNLVEFMLHNHEEYYNFSDGDKDLFRFAMLALRKRWAVPGRHRELRFTSILKRKEPLSCSFLQLRRPVGMKKSARRPSVGTPCM